MTHQLEWPRGSNRSERIDDVLRRQGLDLLLALSAENATYLAGRSNFFADVWRAAGIFSVVAAIGGVRIAIESESMATRGGGDRSISYTGWTETVDPHATPGSTIAERIVASRPHVVSRPEQFDYDEIVRHIVTAIHDVTSAPRRIGIDLERVNIGLYDKLRQALPGVDLIDASEQFVSLRALKDADEIAHLRLAADLTEIGIAATVSQLQIGQTELGVNAIFQATIYEAADDPRFAAFRMIQGGFSLGFGAKSPRRVSPGETIKLDASIDISGYSGDLGRTFAFDPTADQITVYDALRDALMTAQEWIRPGVTFADVYGAGISAMRNAGFTNYSRGHLGHSDGLTLNFEEGPFIAPGEQRLLEPGIVLSLELPYYVHGTGAFQLERMFLVTENGHEVFDRLPFEFSLSSPA